MEITFGFVEAESGEILWTYHEAEHPAIVELQSPVVVAVELQEGNPVAILLFYLFEIRFSEHFEAVSPFVAAGESDSFGRQSDGFSVLIHYLVGVETGGVWRIKHAETVGIPSSHAWRRGFEIAEEIVYVGEEIEHSGVWEEVGFVEWRNVLQPYLAQEGEGVVVFLAFIFVGDGGIVEGIGHIGIAPHLRMGCEGSGLLLE